MHNSLEGSFNATSVQTSDQSQINVLSLAGMQIEGKSGFQQRLAHSSLS